MISTPLAPECTVINSDGITVTKLHLGSSIQVIDLIVTPTKVEVTFRRPSNAMYACNPPRPMPDEVWKEVYEVGVTDGGPVLVTVAKVHGTHTPAHQVEEKVEFPEGGAS